MTKQYKYLYGPVPSRRIGLSLGVDILKPKTCTFNCIYCQLKKTDTLTTERQSFFPPDEIIDEIRERITVDKVKTDYITFSGSGEPTLSQDIGVIIDGIKEFTDIPVAVITNGSLLWKEEVRQDILHADLVIPSLDAALEESFHKINRPHPALKLDKIKQGILDFRKEYQGQIWLEILFVAGINDSGRDLDALLAFIEQLGPDKVQLNTVERPPLEKNSLALSSRTLHEIVNKFSGRVEIAGESGRKIDIGDNENLTPEEAIMEMLRRRPCTAIDINSTTGFGRDIIVKALDTLHEKGSIIKEAMYGKEYYRIK
ncbi:MAG: radical SAM protein [Acidobacteria bacterium]|nr:radical SAM protein [Acidobacteriota bacterium]